jgi:hypothetical protein
MVKKPTELAFFVACMHAAMTPIIPTKAASVAAPVAKRFDWKMRLFLGLVLFCMVYRCVGQVLPMYDWGVALGVQRLPRPLPTPAEKEALRTVSGTPDPVLAEYGAVACALADYCNPWPDHATREHIHSPLDGVEYAASWVDARIGFLECLVGVRQRWQMFAPSLDKAISHVRARLFYDDDTETIVHQLAEPADFTRGGHSWFEERILSHEVYTQMDASRSWGYCNLLAHRHARNASGAKLVYITLFCVWVMLPEPGVDAQAHYEQQNRLTASPPRLVGSFRSDSSRAASGQVWPDYFGFDVATGTGSMLGV